MSLIQDALHRRDAEIGKLKPALKPELMLKPEPAPPPLPPPEAVPPTPPPASPPPARNANLGKVVVLVVLLLALAGYGVWFFFLRAPDKPAPVVVKPPPATNAPAVVKAPVTNAPAVQPTNIVAQVKTKLEATVTPERRELVMGQTNAPAAVTAAPPVAVVTPVVPPVTPAATSAAPIIISVPEPLTSPAPAVVTINVVRWPKLVVTGIMGRSGGDSVAFINGQILKVGDAIAEARVLAIAETGVQMAFQGETNTIRVGKGTE